MIETDGLFYVFGDGTVGLQDISLNLPTGSRTLLIGANGAGKSTLLRILAGKTLAKLGKTTVDGRDPFRDGLQNATYLGTEWASNPTVRRDVPVTLLIASVGGDAYPERRDELVDILDIDLTWRMNAVSDGERRRVQLCMGLLRPWTSLFLDEVTVDLDVLVRHRLLEFLKTETETRHCQIVYATHIFDGLMGWPSHIVHMHLGQALEAATTEAVLKKYQNSGPNSRLLQVALQWLQEDLTRRGQRQKRTWEEVRGTVDEGLDHSEKFDKYFKLTRGRE
ncbi:putative ABC transporter ATP-binding protein C20G4.01 [Wickerhamiella sorbophila]|uniref:Putative ABC transporter ATP-binding protein C20G4.01 n=1 Tax=Wickerhamiella sorbophila TaxID=45607 RepID=A0A2T0FFR6_9ASCO|nr:putative ABC transporter ATP-binding protein C20G4.01 [Wickerhamiella sorbophila]PRT53843.1 putative ABC transporter ATP-binding protein C20G4.01 [Wickerhamiella sorbophila]